VTRTAAPTHKLAASDPSRGAAVWPGVQHRSTSHLVLRLYDDVATRREEARCGTG
jgi:hypothetical protein